MANSYTRLLYHIVFSTKYRKPFFPAEQQEAIWRYIAGIIVNKNGNAIEIGGTEDHIHILTSCSPTIALSDFIRDVKSNSSRWMHDERRNSLFEWQTGYAAFTVSHSQHEVVTSYIRTQAEHHRKWSFQAEYRLLLQRHEIAFDEKYLFDIEFHG